MSEITNDIEILLNGKTIEERRIAAFRLGKQIDERSFPALIEALGDDEDVAIFAKFALVKAGNNAYDYLIKALKNNPNKQVKSHIIEILGELGNEECIPHLISILKKDKDKNIKVNAIEALGRFKNHPEIVNVLTNYLNDEDIYVMSMAALMLYRMGVKDNIADQLIERLIDTKKNNKNIISWVLVELKDMSVVEKLMVKLNELEEDEIKDIIKNVLQEMNAVRF